MAKGFTVKAKSPVTKKENSEWDYEKAREMIRGKSIVFCLPGRGVSYTYLKSFVQLCFDLVQSGASIQISQDYSSMVNFARCKCLGANVLRGPDQIPWDGKLKYDYQLWIDSDIVFNTEKFYQLVLMDQDIAAGWYATEDGHTTSVAHWLDEDDFRGSTRELTQDLRSELNDLQPTRSAVSSSSDDDDDDTLAYFARLAEE